MSEPEQSRSEGGGGRPPGRRGAKPCPKCQQIHWEVVWKNGAFHGRAWDPVKKMPRTRKAGSHALAFKVAAKLATEIAERKHFPKPAPVWDPVFAAWKDKQLAGYVADFLARNGSTLVDLAGAERLAHYLAHAPEFQGKTMREQLRVSAELYRER